MNFDYIPNRVGTYETADNSAVAAGVQSIIAEHRLEIFKDPERLVEEINGLSLSKAVKAQLTLIVLCSTLSDFVLNSKDDLNLVDVDNAIHNIVQSTGLSHQVVIRLVADVFYGCGFLDFAMEYGPQITDGNLEYKQHILLSSEAADVEIAHAESLVADYRRHAGKSGITKNSDAAQEAAGDAVAALHKLCSAGIAKGFYLLGRCYLYGDCGTDIDTSKGSQLMQVAAKQGIAEAAAEIGDFYYQTEDPTARDYTLAHYYYTRPGAIAMGKERQRALQDIYKQHTANKTTLVFTGVLLAMMVAFLTFFHTGIFSGSSRLVIGIIMTVVSGLAYGCSILYYHLKEYNGLRWAIAVQYFIWAIYAFILVLA